MRERRSRAAAAWRLSQRLVVVLSLVAAQAPCAQPQITATGDWSTSVGPSDLQSGAGSDLVATHESAPGVGFLDISATAGPLDAWRIDVHRLDAIWHGDLTLSVRRTSDGVGLGGITGGTTYRTVGESPQSFFSGSGDRSLVNVQLRVTGVSVNVPPAIYSTTVVYTVVDTD